MDTPELLTHLAAHLGLAGLQLDDQGCCALQVGDELVLNVRWLPDDERLVLFALLGLLPVDGRAACAIDLLRGNRFGLATAGARLSVDESEPPRVLLDERVDARRASPAEFVETVECFADTARRWMTRLAELPTARPAADAMAGVAPHMPSFA
jgi:hypothetical protein